MVQCSNYPTTVRKIRELFLVLAFTSVYFMYEAHWTVTNKITCLRRHHRDVIAISGREDFEQIENDVILEYKQLKNIVNVSKWSLNDCSPSACTRVILSGFTEGLQNKTTTIQPTKLRYNPATPSASAGTRLLNCSQIAEYFDDPVAMKFEPYKADQIRTKQGIHETHGMLVFPSRTKKYVITSEAKRNTTGYRKLYEIYEKHIDLGIRLPGIPELYGACINEKYVRLVTRFTKGQKLCASGHETEANYSETDCYKLTKLHNLVQSRRDKVQPVLSLIQSVLCLFSELEHKRYFLHDVHGSQFSLNPDMSIVVNDMDNLFHHGSRNIFGGSICIDDSHCAAPSGGKWSNTSANHVIYSPCHDASPVCDENKCAGFNASLHLCGVTRWMTSLVLNHLTRLKERIRLVHALALVSNPHPRLRHVGREACEQVTEALENYKSDPEKSAAGYHVGAAKKPKI
nr:uncharacterized protein LOC100184164 [Ciona intestinalis]|eukprot:XP_002127645.1 uncharacterized protein LOC100184164 [Ciona intestinalis]